MLIKEEGTKVNFIDENDIFVGYDTYQCCCENAGWFIADSVMNTDELLDEFLDSPFGKITPDVEDFVFDPSYGETFTSVLDDGGIAVFRLVNSDGYAIFLHLYNAHNGYYGHGFESNTILGDGGL